MEYPGEDDEKPSSRGCSCIPAFFVNPCDLGRQMCLHPVNYLLSIVLFMMGLLVFTCVETRDRSPEEVTETLARIWFVSWITAASLGIGALLWVIAACLGECC